MSSRCHLVVPPSRRRRQPLLLPIDLVHAAMGEYEARLLRGPGYQVSIDHPYQHYQFAGRADVLAWSAAGSINAKRHYLARVVSQQLDRRPFVTQTHVMVGLWSAEVLRALRNRAVSFQALCPVGPDAWWAWLDDGPTNPGTTATLVLLDPFASGRRRAFISLGEALGGARSRVHGYADAADRLRSQGLA